MGLVTKLPIGFISAIQKEEAEMIEVNYYRLKPVAWTNRLQAD
jgi:hypothetical protein